MVSVARTLVCLAIAGASTIALAQPKSQAAEYFSRGQTAQAEGRYRDAINEYEQAYELVPHANALFNIAFCYEQLGDWQQSADFYQRYLDEHRDKPAPDAATVTDKIRVLRAKPAVAPADPYPAPAPTPIEPSAPSNASRPATFVDAVAPPSLPPTPRWHVGAAYGLGFGDAPTERYHAYGGRRFAGRIDVDALIGNFGKNDKGLGVMGRFLLTRRNPVTPFLRAAVTIGYAKQDASSIAETRFPVGLELGGGAQLGMRGKVEIDVAVRWLRGGWDAAATTADSYANDSVAVGFDVGLAFDIPVTSGAR
jgi:Tfp pilus assembly protein PilF